MKVTLTRMNDAVHFEARTESGGIVNIDGGPTVGGQGLGARPMEVVLTALGGCSGIDVMAI
ncbi:MAG: OsmC family peroxiredoxin, partial [Gemmatimonadota bacterium]